MSQFQPDQQLDPGMQPLPGAQVPSVGVTDLPEGMATQPASVPPPSMTPPPTVAEVLFGFQARAASPFGCPIAQLSYNLLTPPPTPSRSEESTSTQPSVGTQGTSTSQMPCSPGTSTRNQSEYDQALDRMASVYVTKKQRRLNIRDYPNEESLRQLPVRNLRGIDDAFAERLAEKYPTVLHLYEVFLQFINRPQPFFEHMKELTKPVAPLQRCINPNEAGCLYQCLFNWHADYIESLQN